VASKRRASARLSASEPEVKRVKSNADLSQVKSTTSKSKYFESEDSEPESESDESVGASSESAYEEAKDESSSAEEAELEEPSDSEEDTKKKTSARGKQRQSTGGGTDALRGKELWREGAKLDLKPGQEVIIAKPKAREAGKTPYQDETLHPNTRLFLIDLADNNDRQWLKGECSSTRLASGWLTFAAHDPDYRAAKKDFETFVDTLTPKIASVDATVPELPVKDLVG
jgi:hypothetical protein